MKTLNESIFGAENMVVSSQDEESYGKFQEFCGNELADIVEIFGKHDIYSLETQMEDISVGIKKMPGTPGSPVKENETQETSEDDDDEQVIAVTSKYLGILHLNNEKNAPYVKVGSKVRKGQVLAIIVTMNITNEVRSPEAGEIVSILEDDGKPVEYGQMLFLLRQ